MTATVLVVHSLLRWAIVLLALLVLSRAVHGLRSGRAWTQLDQRAGLGLVISMDLQFVVGLLLYHVSVLTPASLGDLRDAMHDSELRYFAVEHVVGMVLALIAVHIGWARAKRAVDDPSRFRSLAVGIGLCALLLALSVPWPWLANGRPLFPF